ncbi:hypothetical protein HDU93_005393, partial [Gonapodya sp. JEL0774]
APPGYSKGSWESFLSLLCCVKPHEALQSAAINGDLGRFRNALQACSLPREVLLMNFAVWLNDRNLMFLSGRYPQFQLWYLPIPWQDLVDTHVVKERDAYWVLDWTQTRVLVADGDSKI